PIPIHMTRITSTILCTLTNPPPSTTYTLSLHDALPISRSCSARCKHVQLSKPQPSSATFASRERKRPSTPLGPKGSSSESPDDRSEEHTSELQSHLNLVCRLLLEKKKNR